MQQALPYSLFITVGPAVNYPAAAWMGLFGESLLSARVFFALVTLGFLAVWWRLAWRYTSLSRAWWAVLLLLGSLQVLTYGVQYLGELPGLLFIGSGLLVVHRYLQQAGYSGPGQKRASDGPATRKTLFLAALLGVCWGLAVLCKANFIVPLGVLVLGAFIHALLRRRFRKMWLFWFVAGAVILLIYGGMQAVRFAALPSGELLLTSFSDPLLQQSQMQQLFNAPYGFARWLRWWQLRLSYGEEFWVWNTEGWWLLLKKPVLWLGFLAAAVKAGFRRTYPEVVLAALFGLFLLMFLASAGFERFLLWLYPFAVVFLGEWGFAIWSRLWQPWQRQRYWQGPLYFLVFFALAWQRTPVELTRRLLHPETVNREEKAFVRQINKPPPALQQWRSQAGEPLPLHVADLQVLPFLRSAKVKFRIQLPIWPPAALEPSRLIFPIPVNEGLLLGPYQHSEYRVGQTPEGKAIPYYQPRGSFRFAGAETATYGLVYVVQPNPR
mgnify:CR=1 FL=1